MLASIRVGDVVMSRWCPHHQSINWHDSIRASDNRHPQGAFPLHHSYTVLSEPMKEKQCSSLQFTCFPSPYDIFSAQIVS